MATQDRIEVRPGDTVRVELPYSEVCCHMRVAGEVWLVQVLPTGAQILEENGDRFSFPIGHAEAGILGDGDGLYAYGERSCEACRDDGGTCFACGAGCDA